MEPFQLDDGKPPSEFHERATALLDAVKRTRRPWLSTENDNAAVVPAVEEYEALLAKIEILVDLALGREDIREGRILSSESMKRLVRGQGESC